MTTKEAVNWLISVRADIGKMEHQDLWHYEQALAEIIDVLENAVPVVHGKWQITGAYPHNVYCSVCHKKFAQTHWAVWEDGSLSMRNYCPNCGAFMDGKDGDADGRPD